MLANKKRDHFKDREKYSDYRRGKLFRPRKRLRSSKGTITATERSPGMLERALHLPVSASNHPFLFSAVSAVFSEENGPYVPPDFASSMS